MCVCMCVLRETKGGGEEREIVCESVCGVSIKHITGHILFCPLSKPIADGKIYEPRFGHQEVRLHGVSSYLIIFASHFLQVAYRVSMVVVYI